jgi:uncharacterized protein (UPF0548 family)
MLSLRKPSVERLRDFLAVQSKLDLTYAAVGATAVVPPAGYVVDHTRIKLGEGARTFAVAKAALGRWDHFRLGWVETWPPETPIQADQVVAVVARLFGLWWLNACRIVYVVDEQGPVHRYGFAYGTLPEHANRVRNGSPWSGTGRTMRCGTTSWPSPARSNSRHGWATPSHGGCKGASPGIRRRRCGEWWPRAHQRLR